MSHLGRPDGRPNPEYSLQPVAECLQVCDVGWNGRVGVWSECGARVGVVVALDTLAHDYVGRTRTFSCD